MNKRILVTGATGFIGRALCHALLEKGYVVRIAVRSEMKTAGVCGQVETCVIPDIGQNTVWDEALKDIDIVVHLAARAHIIKGSAGNSLSEYESVNTDGAVRLAMSASKTGVKRVIYISTVKVNGERTKEKPFKEDDVPLPEDAYAISKWKAEVALQKISAETGLELVILRFPLVYGPYVKANFLRLLNWVKKDIPIPLAFIQNKRSLVYVRNAADAIISCFNHSKAAGEVFLVSDGQDVSTPELMRLISTAMNKKARLLPFPLVFLKTIARLTGKFPEIERLTSSLCVDSNKIRNLLEWKAPFTVEQGVLETVKWYNSI
jgi:nucleoside-diphosphate-sugar epimerase